MLKAPAVLFRPQVFHAFLPTGRSRHTSAELLTTAKILRRFKSSRPPIEIARIVLLASETPAGQFAAEVTREVMGCAEYRPVTPVPPVTIEPIPAPTSEGVMETLSDRILEAVNRHRGPETGSIFFNITAGFGAVSTLIGMQSIHYGYRLCYQHESMKQPVYIAQNLRAYTYPPWDINPQ